MVFQIRPPALSCPKTTRLSCSSGAKLRVERVHELPERAVDDRRVVRQGGHRSTSDRSRRTRSPRRPPRSPIAAVRFAMKPAPSFSSTSARLPAKDSSCFSHQRREFLEQLPWLPHRHVTGEERIGRQILRRAPGAGVGQPGRHPRPRAVEHQRDLVLFRSSGGTLLDEQVLHPDHRRQLDRWGVVSCRHRDHRGRIDADQPAGAPPVPLADGCRKRRARALAPGGRGPTPDAPASSRRPSGRRTPNRATPALPTSANSPSRARASSARLPGCTRAITIGTSSPGASRRWHRRRSRHRAAQLTD